MPLNNNTITLMLKFSRNLLGCKSQSIKNGGLKKKIKRLWTRKSSPNQLKETKINAQRQKIGEGKRKGEKPKRVREKIKKRVRFIPSREPSGSCCSIVAFGGVQRMGGRWLGHSAVVFVF